MAIPEDLHTKVGAPAPEPAATGEDDDLAGAPADVRANPQSAAGNAWRALKQEVKTLKPLASKVTQLETELAQARAKAAKPEESAEIQRKLQEYEDKIGQLDLRESSAFKARYDAVMQSEFEGAVQLMIRGGQEPEAARSLVMEMVKSGDFAEIESRLAALPAPLQGAVYSKISRITDVAQERSQALQDWQTSRAALAENQGRESMASMTQNIARDTEAAVQALRDEQNFMFMLSESDEAWNNQVHDRIRTVKAVLRDAKDADLVKYVADGVTAPAYRKLYVSEKARADKAEAQLRGILSANPRLGAGASPAPGAPKGPVKPRSPEEVAGELFKDGHQQMF